MLEMSHGSGREGSREKTGHTVSSCGQEHSRMPCGEECEASAPRQGRVQRGRPSSSRLSLTYPTRRLRPHLVIPGDPPPPPQAAVSASPGDVCHSHKGEARQVCPQRSLLPPLRSMRKQGTQKTTVLGSADCYPPPPGRAPGISPGTKPPTSSSKGNLLSLHVFGARGAKLTDLPDRPPYRIMMDWDSASRLSPGASSGTERWVCAPQRGVRFIRKRRDHDQKAAACQLVVTGYEKETRSDGARVSPHTHPRLQVGIGTLLLRVCSEWLTPRRCYVSAPCLSAYG